MYTDENYNDFDESTELDNTPESTLGENANMPAGASQMPQGQHGVWKKVAIGTATGIVFGTIATSFVNAITKENAESENEDDVNDDTASDTEATANPLVDSSISMASGVNDGMSFSQAFASARAEVGAGGVFEWHGNLYGTYTAEEWDSMSAEEHADYNNHFAWSSHESSGQQATHHDTYADTQSDVAINATATAENIQVEEVVDQPNHVPEVEVLGVVHNNETGANIGGMLIDGQGAILVDVDGNEVFDYGITDLNQDGQITEDEIEDISNLNITVDDLGGLDNIDDDQADITDDSGMMYV